MNGMIVNVTSVRAHENLKATTIAATVRDMNWTRIPSLGSGVSAFHLQEYLSSK